MGDYSKSRYLAKTGKSFVRKYEQTGKYRKDGKIRPEESVEELVTSSSIRDMLPTEARDAFCRRMNLPLFEMDTTAPLAPIMNFSRVLKEEEFCPLRLSYFAFDQGSMAAQADFLRLQLAKSNAVDDAALLTKIQEYENDIIPDSMTSIASTIFAGEEDRNLLKDFPGFGLVIDMKKIAQSTAEQPFFERLQKIIDDTTTIEESRQRIEWVERLISGEENVDSSERIRVLPMFQERFYNADGSPRVDKLEKVIGNFRERIAAYERRIKYCELSENPVHLFAYAHPEINGGNFVVAHEAGHMVQLRFIEIFGENSPDLKIISELFPMSYYGCTDGREHFAEIYSAYRFVPEELPPEAVAAMDRIVAAVRKING